MVDELQVLPSSFAQQRLWFLDQLVPGSPCYNLSSVLRFRAPLDPEVLRTALIELAKRHEVLRTTFATVDGRPVQVLSPDPRFPLDVEDVRELSAGRDAVASRALGHARRTFDLAKGPLARAVLFQRVGDESMLLICMHHIIADGWSMDVLSRELVALIHAIAEGRPHALEPLPIQYGDYAVWQRQRLQGRRLEELLAYWRDKLAGLPTLDVPTDRPRPLMPSFRGARVAWSLPPDLSQALRAFARDEGATLFMLLLSGFAALLGRYAGEDDVAIGSPAANRDRAEVEGLIGFFVNTLVLRVDLGGAPSLRQLVRRVRALTVDVLAHQEVPFERLVEELAPERSLSRSPLVQVMFQFFDDAFPGERLGETPRSPRQALDFDQGTAPFDLCCTGWPSGAGLVGFVEYSIDLFDAATCERLLGHMIELLRRGVSEPDRPLASIPLLSEEEYVRQVETWNATERPLPEDDLVRLFRACVRRAPRAVAVEGPGEALTYANLDARAGALARHLHDLGVGPDARVAILLERGQRWAEAMLAVVMAGGVYVPLDEDNPPSRLALVIEDATPSLVLTSRALAPRLTAVCPHLVLDELAPAPAEFPTVPRRPDDPLYIIYTSGSTGRPKGVVVPQRAVARLVRETDYIALAPSDRVAQASNMAFDAATFELWGALLSGASLHLVSRDELLDPGRLEAALREGSISVLFVTTALFNQVANLRPAAFAGLRMLLFGGEVVDPAAVRRVLRHGPPGELLHVYGPTENTTFSTWHRVRDVADDAATVPIGRPIANTTCYVVDARGQPVPVGVVGELWLGGAGLALGYLDRPALTAARFVPDAFRPGRLYRTGDLVRSRPDGALEFVGRVDTRSSCGAFASSSARSRPRCSRTMAWCRRSRSCARTVPAIGGWSRTWSRAPRSRCRSCASTSVRGCRPTCSRRRSSCSTRCRSTPTARSTAPRCRCPSTRGQSSSGRIPPQRRRSRPPSSRCSARSSGSSASACTITSFATWAGTPSSRPRRSRGCASSSMPTFRCAGCSSIRPPRSCPGRSRTSSREARTRRTRRRRSGRPHRCRTRSGACGSSLSSRRTARSTTSRRRCASAAASMATHSSAPCRRSCAATTSSARRSRRSAASPCSASRPRCISRSSASIYLGCPGSLETSATARSRRSPPRRCASRSISSTAR